ncbi:MAG: CRTAC1 family protein [Phycisphaerae bacterium]
MFRRATQTPHFCAMATLAIAPAATAVEYSTPIPFTEEALDRGLNYTMQGWPQDNGYLGFGCGFADLDHDGDPDIVLLGAADGHVGLFENDGAGQFTDRSVGSGLPIPAQPSGFVAGDYDGDGDLDLYFSQVTEPNILVRNEGNWIFSDVTIEAAVGDAGASKSACFGDFDNDGCLDLYSVNYYLGDANESINRLYHNLGNGSFEDVGALQTVDDDGYGFQAAWFDYDRDGDVDLYLSNDKGHQPPFLPNQLWRNDDGRLINVSQESGADVALFSMGLACGDLDGNGWPDLYCTNIPGGGGMNNPLLLNQGDGTFVESATAAGVENPFESWGALFCDFDNNGHADLYVNNLLVPNALYLNFGAFPTVESGLETHVGAGPGLSFSSAVADIDNDGDLDLLVNNLVLGNVELFINHDGETRDWIKYDVVGQGANRFAVGAGIDTRLGDKWRFREILAGGNGYLGQNELIVHVGLNSASVVDEVVVLWPGGESRTLTGLETRRTWRIYPPERLGDGDGDGDIDMNDVAILVGVLLGSDADPDHALLNDMNGDGDVDGADIPPFVSMMLLQ